MGDLENTRFPIFFVYFSAIWGTGFYKTMSRSLKEEFPSVSGFSVTNLKYIKRFLSFIKVIGISEYQLSKVLPKEIESSLPSIEEIKKSLKDIAGE